MPFRVVKRFCCLLLTAALALPALAAEPETETARRTYTPEIEAKLADLMTKLREPRTKLERLQIQKTIAEVGSVTGLGEAGKKALEERAGPAVDAAVNDWIEKMEAGYRENIDPGQAAAIIGEVIANSSYASMSRSSAGSARAEDQPSWQDALREVLGPERAAAWKTVVDERERKFEEQLKGLVAMNRERVREQNAQTILAKVAALKAVLSLDEERTKKLEKLAEEAAKKSADGVEDQVRKMVRSFEEKQREQMLKTRNFMVGSNPKDAPEKQKIWTDGLAQILTAEERARWEADMKVRTERRVRAMARVFLMFMDEKVALTASQREKLLPLAEQCVRGQKAFFPEGASNSNHYYSTQVRTFRQAAKEAKDEALSPILDASQLVHWREAGSEETRPRRANSIAARRFSPPAAPGETPAPVDPVEIENAISDHFYTSSNYASGAALAEAMLRAEDASRVAGLDESAAKKLQTAARGSVEKHFASWRSNVADNMRAQLQNVNGADFRQQLASMGGMSPGPMRGGAKSDATAFWDRVVEAELTPEQRAAWTKEIDAREAASASAIGLMLLSDLDRICFLTREQWDALDPLVTQQVEDYLPDIEQTFSVSDDSRWFLQSYYMLMPITGIPEETMKKILTDGQWKQWTESHQYINGVRYWSNIKSNHKRRMKAR